MKLSEKYKVQNIDRLDVSCNVIETLKSNEINNLGELCEKSKTDLKEMNIQYNDVNQISVQLQLLGLNLKGAY